MNNLSLKTLMNAFVVFGLVVYLAVRLNLISVPGTLSCYSPLNWKCAAQKRELQKRTEDKKVQLSEYQAVAGAIPRFQEQLKSDCPGVRIPPQPVSQTPSKPLSTSDKPFSVFSTDREKEELKKIDEAMGELLTNIRYVDDLKTLHRSCKKK